MRPHADGMTGGDLRDVGDVMPAKIRCEREAIGIWLPFLSMTAYGCLQKVEVCL